jgi:hypothetical protein
LEQGRESPAWQERETMLLRLLPLPPLLLQRLES